MLTPKWTNIIEGNTLFTERELLQHCKCDQTCVVSVVYALPEVSLQGEATELCQNNLICSGLPNPLYTLEEVSMQKLCCLSKFQLHTPHLNSIDENLQNKDVK